MDTPAVQESPVARERAALRDLVESPGWALLVEHFREPSTAESVMQSAYDLLASESAGTPALEMRLRQIIATCSTIREVLLYPKQRLQTLAEAKEDAPDAPRGIAMPPLGGDPHLVRRG